MRFPTPHELLFCFLAILMACPPLPASAKNSADIVEILVDKDGKDLEVSFRLENCFTPKMEEAIQNGVPTTFRILVAVEKPGVMLFRSQVVDFMLEHTIKYNRINNEFQISLPEHPGKTVVTKDFTEAKRWMSTVENLPVMPTCWLRQDQEYSLKVKAELSKVEMPLFFRYVFFWVALWDFETDWQKVNFSM